MIPYGRHHIDEEDIEAVATALRGATLTQGKTIDAFEEAVARYVGVKHAVAVSSGTAALHLAALAAGVGEGSTLITTPITFVASANAGICAGSRVAFADVDPRSGNMAPESLEAALKAHPGTRAVIPVHYGGLPCDMERIHQAAERAGAVVIEDAAHALGSVYPSGRKVGSCEHSLMTVFSFHPVKAIAAGEGGMITTNDTAVYRRLLRLRSHGINKLDDPLEIKEQALTDGVPNPWYYEVQELGFHFRITDIQCALGLSQLKKLEKFIARRHAIADRYDAAFAGMRHVRAAQQDPHRRSARHLYVTRIDFGTLGRSRAELMLALRERGIGTQVHYIPVPAHPYYRRMGFRPEDYPHSLAFYESCLSIPIYFALTDEQQQQVVSAFRELVG